jgi:peptide/nickel transport system substrate-binding protein
MKMAINYRFLDALRRGLRPHENHLIDGLVDGRIGRRDFLRHGSVLGLSAPLLGGVAGALGIGFAPRVARAASPGGKLRVGQSVPAAAIDPVTIADNGGIVVMSQVGEYLCLSGKDLKLEPMLAESWSTNNDGTVWTFKIRKGVKFHDGREMKADDVVASINRIADPKNGSNGLSAFTGYLGANGAKKADDYTVEFHLDAANGNFPYLVSSDNYNTIIMPADYKGGFEQHMIGTGPFKMESYTAKVGAAFVRNPDYWGGAPNIDRVELVFYADYQPQVLALQAGEIDIIEQAPVLQSVGILNDPNINIISLPSAAHEQVHMRTDKDPFKDPRVRRAIALCLDRNGLVKGLMKGRAQKGNDSPFAAAFPSTDRSVPQREKNIAEAKQLMEAAGMAKGFEVTLTTENYLEIPAYAQVIQSAVKEIGGKINLNVMDQGAYYGDAVYGKSPWLDSDMGITDYGHRGVPNVFLSAPLRSDGTWNAAHFKNAEYDKLVTSYIAALDLESQRSSASKIQKLLLDETPIIFGYFYDFLTATRKNVADAHPTAMGQLFLNKASISA